MPSEPRSRGLTAILYSEPLSRWHRQLNLSPAQLTVLGFAIIILLGALVLWLPVSVAPDKQPSFLTALFTSTSAVCVTGLIVVDTPTYFSTFGQVTIMLLIQIGGLGYMTMYSLMMIAVGRRLSLRDRFAVQEVLDTPGPGGVLRFVLQVLAFTMVIEFLGMLVLAWSWVPEHGWGRGLYLALFHAVSAFNNAGFSLFSDSLMSYRAHPIIILTVAGLVILGGLGYPVLAELWRRLMVERQRHILWRHLSLNTRVGLITTGWLLLIGTIMLLLLESGNPKTLGTLPWWDQLMSAFFSAVMPRTAGFNSLDIAAMTHAALFFTILLMFIGTNPGGTGGGVKTTTLAVLLAQAMAVIKGDQAITVQQRRLNVNTLRKAITTIIVSWGLVNVVAMLLSVTERQDFLPLLFETVSAFGTVGLSANVTPTLSTIGQLLIVATMFAGRVGVLTLAMAAWKHQRPPLAQHPEEGLLVG